jgi:hypothetical protein
MGLLLRLFAMSLLSTGVLLPQFSRLRWEVSGDSRGGEAVFSDYL